MSKMHVCLVGILCLLATARAASGAERIEKIEFSAVTREVDLTSNLAKQKTTIIVENKDSKTISSFLYTIPRGVTDKLAYIGGQVSLYPSTISIRCAPRFVHIAYREEKEEWAIPRRTLHGRDFKSVGSL